MAEPTKKAPEIERLIDATNPSGRKRVDSIKQDICSWCGEPATEFKDDLSRKEYTISGFCQECQDGIFSPCPGMRGKEYDGGPPVVQSPGPVYCVMKCLRDLNNKEYVHLPDFCTAEEHGKGNPVTLRHGNGEEICQLDWDTFRKVYVMD